MAFLIRMIVLRLVKIFYPRIEVQHLERLPRSGPRIFVANHPNGLIDPLVIMAGLDQPISFLAKSTFFANPAGRLMMSAFNALPVFRQRDEGKSGGPQGDAARRNEETFERCRALLAQGKPMALFPEGTTHSGTVMLPLRTGAARIALSAEAANNWDLNLQIVPVGLWYQHKTQFRSSALLVVGEPFTLEEYAQSYAQNARIAVHQLTERVDSALDEVVLQAESSELFTGIPLVAAWTLPGEQSLSLQAQHERASALLYAYHELKQRDPERLEKIVQAARRYARVLRTFGITKPWDFELAEAKRVRLLWLLIYMIVSFPFALLGFIISYLPYRAVRPIVPRVVGKFDEVTSTGKLIVGTILVPLGWIIASAVLAWFAGWQWGLLLLCASPLLAYIALYWGECWVEWRDVASYNWLRLRHRELSEAVIERRQQLSAEVLKAAQDIGVIGPDGRVTNKLPKSYLVKTPVETTS